MTAAAGDVVDLDLGLREGREAGFPRPAVLVTAQRILDGTPTVIHVVPLTSTIRSSPTEVVIEPDAANGLHRTSAGQVQHLRAASPRRITATRGNVGPAVLAQLREAIAVLLDLPA